MQAVALHCLCGHSILCQVVREGERLGSLVFSDDEVTTSTYGERIELAPSVARGWQFTTSCREEPTGGSLEGTSEKSRVQEHLESTPSGELLVGEGPPPLDVCQCRKRFFEARHQAEHVLAHPLPEHFEGAAP
jgi:hypothetical protein